ncbi:MAG: 6-carboxytetrahydropterin synthase [Melioribacteraceae bacterium]|nr:6-carboxytetrahydropterin synthase [Melioribacteraceae bacterium]
MKIAKEFRWEMGHRLPFHEDKCKNLHGHSYKMMVEFTGTEDENGMVLDYYEVKEIIAPLVDELDHSFMVYEKDTKMIDFLVEMDMKHLVTPFHSTAENMVHYFLKKISEANLPKNITAVMVKVFETESTYAEDEIKL